MVYSKEVCPKTNRDHRQVYAKFGSPKTLSACQKTLKVGNSKGTPAEAAGYCKKGERSKPCGKSWPENGWALFADDTVWGGKEFGKRMEEPTPGERTDVTAFRDR